MLHKLSINLWICLKTKTAWLKACVNKAFYTDIQIELKVYLCVMIKMKVFMILGLDITPTFAIMDIQDVFGKRSMLSIC